MRYATRKSQNLIKKCDSVNSPNYLMMPLTISRPSNQESGPIVRASCPTSVPAALPFVTKSRFVQMIMLFLHRVSMTFVLREFFKNPTPWVRTRETIMWSSSFPVGSVSQILPACQGNYWPWKESTLKHLSSRGSFANPSWCSIVDLWPSYGVRILYCLPWVLYIRARWIITDISCWF